MKKPPRRLQQFFMSGIVVLSLAAAVRANELRNPGFEEGYPNWWYYGNLQVETWWPHTGLRSAVLPSFAGGYGGTGQDVGLPARPGDIVTYSVYGYAEQNYTSTTADTFLQVEFWVNGASSASQVNKAFVYAQLDANRQAWILLTMTVTNTLSDVTMVKGLFGGGGWKDLSMANQACFMDDAALTPSTRNLLGDPGFENGGSWWSYGQVGREWWAAQTGRTGVAFYAWNADGSGGFGQDVVVNQSNGQIYEFSIWGLAEANYSSSASETWLKMELWDGATLKQTVQKDIYAALKANPNTWQLFTLTVTNTTDTITLAKPVVGGAFWNATGGSESAKWDNGYFRQINPKFTGQK